MKLKIKKDTHTFIAELGDVSNNGKSYTTIRITISKKG